MEMGSDGNTNTSLIKLITSIVGSVPDCQGPSQGKLTQLTDMFLESLAKHLDPAPKKANLLRVLLEIKYEIVQFGFNQKVDVALEHVRLMPPNDFIAAPGWLEGELKEIYSNRNGEIFNRLTDLINGNAQYFALYPVWL